MDNTLREIEKKIECWMGGRNGECSKIMIHKNKMATNITFFLQRLT